MLRIHLFILFATFFAEHLPAQSSAIHTSDISNFWAAYDSIKATADTARQLEIIQTLYIGKGTTGLKELIDARNLTAKKWLKNLKKYPAFWASVRPRISNLDSKKPEIEGLIKRFKEMYPALKPVEIYFTVGCLNTGGTVSGKHVLIGAEMACSDSSVNSSELSHWHQAMFRSNSDILDWLAHEIGHTQQAEEGADANVLNASVYEGACDFLAGLLLNKTPAAPYMSYGRQHHDEVLKKFDSELYKEDISAWLYNGDDVPEGQADLGYYAGYVICRSYYDKAADKKEALRQIIELDYKDGKKVAALYKKALH